MLRVQDLHLLGPAFAESPDVKAREVTGDDAKLAKERV